MHWSYVFLALTLRFHCCKFYLPTNSFLEIQLWMSSQDYWDYWSHGGVSCRSNMINKNPINPLSSADYKNILKFSFEWWNMPEYLAYFLWNCAGMDANNVEPWTRSTLQYRARCDKHSVLNPPWLIAINSLSPSWAFAISANAYAPVQRCDRGMIPCVMNEKQRGSQPWRVSNSSASYGHQCVLLVVKHRLWTPSQPKLPLLPSLREMGSHLLMSSPPIVKRHLHHVTRPHIVKRHPFNLLIYAASSIVIMVDREMEIW